MAEDTTKYLLTGIPTNFWKQVKMAAASQGVSIREMILGLLELHVSEVLGKKAVHPISKKK